MTEIRQCWAYKWQTGERCDMPGGHPGNHSTSIIWNDADCASPTDLTTMPLIIGGHPPVSEPATPVTHIASEPPAPVKCVACTHHHKSGICKCGCHEHIG